MSDWTEGYVTDVGYTFGYYRELNPLHARIALQDYNVTCPEMQTACELGFGQGVSICIHAAASKTQWYGTDFMPEQADFARQMARVSGTDVHIFNDSFEAFAKRKELPDFDFIGLHGIWAWISNDNRRIIVDFIKKKLKPGGVLYVGYNTLPGWADFTSMRHLMDRYMDDMADSKQNSLEQIKGCMDFLERFLVINPRFVQINPFVRTRLQYMQTKDIRYLAHEYLNKNWSPIHFADMFSWLHDADIDYVCSAQYLDHIDRFNISSDQENFLESISNSTFRETIRDFIVNRQFRWDYWVRGIKELKKNEWETILRTQRYILVNPPESIDLNVSEARGTIALDAELYNPILELMADYLPRTLYQIEEELKTNTIKSSQVYQAILVLLGKGCMEPVQDEASIIQAQPRTAKLNSFLLQQMQVYNNMNTLASPLTGGGFSIALPLIGQFFVEANMQGKTEPQQLAEYAWQKLSSMGRHIIKDGKHLETEEENLADLRVGAKVFVQKYCPILKGLNIA